MNKGLVGLAARLGKTIAVVNPGRHPAFDASVDLLHTDISPAARERSAAMPYSMLCCPIRSTTEEGKVLGVFQLIDKRSTLQSPSELLLSNPPPLASTDRLRSRGLFDATHVLAYPFQRGLQSEKKEGEPTRRLSAQMEKAMLMEFSKNDAAVLESLSAMTATWLQRARTFAEVKRAKMKMEALLEIVRAISKTGNFYSFLNTVARALRKALNPDKLSIFIRDNVKEEVWCAVSEDIELLRVLWDKASLAMLRKLVIQ